MSLQSHRPYLDSLTASRALPRLPAPRLPNSLLWRSVLLIALVLSAGQLTWFELARHFEVEPRARLWAQQLASVVNLTRAALVSAEPGRRRDLLLDLSMREGLRVYPGEPGEAIGPYPDGRFHRLLALHTRARLGPATLLSVRQRGLEGLWVSFDIGGDRYWLMFPTARLERPYPWRWLGFGILVLLLSIVGASLIVWRVNRPLEALARAARRVGRGEWPAPLTPTGPTEVRDLTGAFNQMTANLARVEAERAILLAGISHDLRTPLARLRLGVEILGGNDPALAAELAADIAELDRTIGQFLDFARPEGTEPPAATDLDALVADVVGRYARDGQPVRARAGGLPPARLRPQAVRRLLVNLIDNALRYAGGEVWVETAREGERAVLSVLDRGPGIAAEDAERLKQPFARGEAARSDARGAGLGLAIVERIARLEGGRLLLQPRPGGGLAARVELPFRAPD